MFAPLTSAGGRVIHVKPYLTHYRSHRKIVVIDHEISYIGGMNIGKQYANMTKVKNPWRDTQVRLEGACSLVLEKYFLTDWLCSVKRCDRSDAVARRSIRIQTPYFIPDTSVLDALKTAAAKNVFRKVSS